MAELLEKKGEWDLLRVRTRYGEPVVAALKALGARWDKEDKVWLLDPEKEGEVKQALQDHPAVEAEPPPVDWVPVEGRTFQVKDELKKLGARWDGIKKVWLVKPDKAEEARRLVSRVRGPRTRGRCYECGEYGPVGETCRECYEGTHL